MTNIFILQMQFLRSSTPFAQIQKAALWRAFKPKAFLRQYLLSNIYSTLLCVYGNHSLVTASRSREYQEDIVRKDMDQLALRNRQAQGFYWVIFCMRQFIETTH